MAYYREEAKFFQKLSIIGYLRHVDAIQRNEQKHHLGKLTHGMSLAKLAQVIFVKKHLKSIFSEFGTILKSKGDLALVYDIVADKEGLVAQFQKHILDEGKAILSKTQTSDFIETAIHVYQSHQCDVAGAFRSDSNFATALDKSFFECLNANKEVAQLLAYYCDTQIRTRKNEKLDLAVSLLLSYLIHYFA